MGSKTAISWTSKTWNPWRGCARVSPGCAHCYMFTEQERYGRDPSVVIKTKTWGDPIKWNREAEAAGVSWRVFTCSWSDFFIEEADAWRPDAWAVIRKTPHLFYQILTKRPELIQGRLPDDWGDGYANVALGTSIENDRFVWRADRLRDVRAMVRFISAEPLLSPLPNLDLDGISWVIVGGESGHGFRPMDHAWARDLRDRCATAGIAYFFKQSAATRTEMGTALEEVDGSKWEWRQWPDDMRPPREIVA